LLKLRAKPRALEINNMKSLFFYIKQRTKLNKINNKKNQNVRINNAHRRE